MDVSTSRKRKLLSIRLLLAESRNPPPRNNVVEKEAVEEM